MRIIIEGAGEVGSHLAMLLRVQNHDVTVIDNDPAVLKALGESVDVNTLCGNFSSVSLLKEAGAAKADLFIGVCPHIAQEINIVSSLIAKRLGTKKVIARIDNEDFLTPEYGLMFREMGLDQMFYPEKYAADGISDFLRHNSTAEIMDFSRGRLQIAVFKIDEDSPMLDLKLSEFISTISPEELKEFRVIAISRGGNAIIPKPETKFRFNDLVFTISRRENIPKLDSLFGKSNIDINSVFISGGNQIAAILAATLAHKGLKVKIMEKDRARCVRLSEKLPDNVVVVSGDGRKSDSLIDEGIQHYDAFIALKNNDESNVLACVLAKKMGVALTVAEVENPEYTGLAEDMGVDHVVNKIQLTTEHIFRLTLSSTGRILRYMPDTGTEVLEYTVKPGSAITKAAIKDLNFPANAIIGGIIRGAQALIAVGDTRIEAFDKVAVFALTGSVSKVDRFFR